MELTKKQKTIKYFFYCLIILIADLLQNTAGLFPEIAGARCFLLLAVSVFLSIGENEKSGAFLGLFAGLLWDLSSGVHMGFNCIFLMIICFLVSALVNHIARDTFITNILSASFTTILYCLLYWLFFIIIRGVEGAEMTLFSFYIPCAVYTIVISLILWLILKPVKAKLNRYK
ncbi:MAG: rod shape-determining protein MreD [Eubacterium sp.]